MRKRMTRSAVGRKATPKRKGLRERVADELAAIGRRGKLDPKRVVEWAREHPESTLHGQFQWDDSKAAEEFRIWQARKLIVSVEVEYHDGEKRQVWVSPLPARGKGYRQLVDVLSEEESRAQFLAQALDELTRLYAKYADLHELAGVWAEVKLVKAGKKKG